MEITQFIDPEQIHGLAGLFAATLAHAGDVAGGHLAIIVAIHGHDGVVIASNGAGGVGAIRAEFAASNGGAQLGRRCHLDVGDIHIAVVHAALLHLHDDALIPVAVFGKIGFNRRVAGHGAVHRQGIDAGGGQNIAENSAGNHRNGLALGTVGLIAGFLHQQFIIIAFRFLRYSAGGNQKNHRKSHQQNQNKQNRKAAFTHGLDSFLSAVMTGYAYLVYISIL